MTFAEKILEFNNSLEFKGILPTGIQVMNPFQNNPDVSNITGQFYRKYFSDHLPRAMILGINPGRFGAGATGIPFTDTIRLNENCKINFDGFRTYEPSSVFMYEMIDAFGGVIDFYKRFFLSAICPLGFTIVNNKGHVVNYNYYDSRELTAAVYDFMISGLKQQLAFGIDSSVCFCLGTGKNEDFLRKLNEKYHFFNKIVALEHPRYIMQYKSKLKQYYMDRYLSALKSV